MEAIGIVVIVMAAVASLTKLIDVVSTILRVNVHTEINPIGVLDGLVHGGRLAHCGSRGCS